MLIVWPNLILKSQNESDFNSSFCGIIPTLEPEHPQAQGPLLSLMSNRATLCHIYSQQYGSIHVHSLIVDPVSWSSVGLAYSLYQNLNPQDNECESLFGGSSRESKLLNTPKANPLLSRKSCPLQLSPHQPHQANQPNQTKITVCSQITHSHSQCDDSGGGAFVG